MNRREFFSAAAWKVMAWTPALAVVGMRFHPYAQSAAVGWSGWVTFFGRVVGFVPLR